MNKQTVFSKRRFFTILVVALVLLAASVTWALAQSEVVTYSACVNNASGTIHMLSGDETCNNNEVLIQWNNVGPQGPQGPPGMIPRAPVTQII